MSTRYIPYPLDFDDNYHHDLAWRRQELALKALSISDVLSEVDRMIASEPEESHHPLFSLVAYALDRTTQPGTALLERYRRMIDHAIEALVEAKLADPHAWEVD